MPDQPRAPSNAERRHSVRRTADELLDWRVSSLEHSAERFAGRMEELSRTCQAGVTSREQLDRIVGALEQQQLRLAEEVELLRQATTDDRLDRRYMTRSEAREDRTEQLEAIAARRDWSLRIIGVAIAAAAIIEPLLLKVLGS